MKETKLTMINFTAKEIKKADVTRFRNLIIKLGVKFKTIDVGKQKLKGRQVNMIICDDVGYGMKEIKKLCEEIK